jgi:DNA-binding GntR family transcriptional regulator
MGKQRDEVILRLREKLVRGEIPRGHTFSEKDIAEEFHTSRTPVREAVAILAHEGLLEQVPQVGVMIREMSAPEIVELVRFRIAVEQMVADALCQKKPEAGLRRLRELLGTMEEAAKAQDKVAFLDADTEFHCYAAESVDFGLAAGVLRSIRDRMRILGMDAIQKDDGMQQVLGEHREILEAVEDGNQRAAEFAVERHLRRTADRLQLKVDC